MEKIAFIGCGNMSTCIYDGIRSVRKDDDIILANPHLERLQNYGAKLTTSNVEAFNASDIIFFGVKPQILPTVLEELTLAKVDASNKLIISMAAGIRFDYLYKHLGKCPLIRIMPNTPSRIKLGVTAVAIGEQVSKEQVDLCKSLLEPMGQVIITDEDGINSLGALAGSAPAFIYRFMEALVSECVKHGFSEEESRHIVEQVFFGTASMVQTYQDSSIASLREAVTSKGGTTFQGLAQMTNYKFEQMVSDTIDACLRRTHEFEDMFK